jgi:hypothetical protein
MKKLWQLKNRITGETLNEPQPLPANWGPIFGLEGVKDRLGDLSWLGEEYKDLKWVELEGTVDITTPTPSTPEELVWDQAKQLLADSDWAMLSDVPMTSGQKAAWIEYRRALRQIRTQPGFPNVTWPQKPE